MLPLPQSTIARALSQHALATLLPCAVQLTFTAAADAQGGLPPHLMCSLVSGTFKQRGT